MTKEDSELEIGESILAELIKFKIIKLTQDKISISFLDDNRNAALEHSRASKSGGIKSAESRKIKQENATEPEPLVKGTSTTLEPKVNQQPTEGQPIDRYINREIDKELTMSIKEEPVAAVVEVSLNKKHALQLLADTSFLSVAAMNNLIAIKLVQDYIVSFHEHLAQDGKTHEKFTEFRKHFNNWLRVQLSAKAEPAHRYIKEKAQ